MFQNKEKSEDHNAVLSFEFPSSIVGGKLES